MTDQPVTDLLQEQHDEIRRLIREVQTSAPDARRDAFETLVRLLAVHETSEEMVVHPAVRRLGATGEQVAEDRTAEEDEAKRALADLEGMDTASIEFLAAFATFADDVEVHAEAEERTVFPLLESWHDADELETMATALRDAIHDTRR